MTRTQGPDRDDELFWLACRYLAGEMTAAEEEQLELQLADDQAAREALEQAVELHEAVRLVCAEPAPAHAAPPRRGRRRAAWAVALAAAVLLAVGLPWLASSRRQPPDAPGTAADPNPELVQEDPQADVEVARAWAALRDREAREASAAEAPPPEPLAGSEPGMGEDVVGAEVSVPQWMLTAFAAGPEREGGQR